MTVGVAQFKNAARHDGQAGNSRIPGDSTVFHLQYLDGRLWPVVIWKLNEDVATCPAVDCAAASELADACLPREASCRRRRWRCVPYR